MFTTPDLKATELAGSGSIKTMDQFQSSVYRADISGSGDMDLNVVTDNFFRRNNG